MNKEILVTLLHNNIEELNMITEGFMEMDVFPKAILQLAQRKTEDIQSIINQLATLKVQASVVETKVESTNQPSEIVEDIVLPETTEILIEEQEIEKPATEISIPETKHQIIEEFSVVETEGLSELKHEVVDIHEVTEVNKNHEVKLTTQESKTSTIADKLITPIVSRNETLSKTDNSLSASIANKKITDIKQAISIGDRFRFQRELFKGNGEEMNKTLNYINQLASYDEIVSFLKSKYGWDINSEIVEDFFQIVRRKF